MPLPADKKRINQTDHLYILSIAQTIKSLRIKGKVRQIELAHQLNRSHRHWQKIEAGEVNISATTALSIAKVIKIEPCMLFRSQKMKAAEPCDIICPAETLEILPLGVQICDLHGEVLYMNRAHREFTGKKDWCKSESPLFIWDFLADPSQASVLQTYLKLLANEKPTPTPYYQFNRGINGDPIPIRVDWNYLLDSKQNVTGFLSIITPNVRP